MTFKSKNIQLGELIEVHHGFAFKGEFFTEEPTNALVLTPGNVRIGGGFKFGKPKYYNGSIPEIFVFNPGDIFVTMTDLSKTGDTLGYPARVPSIGQLQLLHNQRLGRIEITQPTHLDIDYLYYLMLSEDYRQEVLASASGSTVKHTSPARIKGYQFVLPPIDRQKEIASILKIHDTKISNNERTITILEQLAQTLFKSWFVDFDPVVAKSEGRKPFGMSDEIAALFPDSFEESELGAVPRGWRVERVENLVSRISITKKYEQKTALPVGLVPILDQGRSGLIGFHNNEPDVFASPIDPVIVFANHTCYMRLLSYPFSAIQNVLPFKGNGVDTTWLYLATVNIQEFISYKGHWPDFVFNKIVVPCPRLQARYKEIALPLLQKMWALDKENELLRKCRDTLLPHLLSSELHDEAQPLLAKEATAA
jgi:type I restriction enzyme S subunit